MASETTWTWLRAFDGNGTTALICLPLAREYQLRQFIEGYPNHEKWVRPAGYYWDGDQMSERELEALRAKPFQVL